MAAVNQLGYVPNLAAQTLASSRSGIIGVIIPSLSNSVFIETLAGIRDCLSANGYQFIIGETRYSSEEERKLLSTHLARAIDGLLLTGIDLQMDAISSLAQRPIPVVHMFDLSGDPASLAVGFSQSGAGMAVGRYVVEHGYKRPALLAAQLDPRTIKRCAGFLAALAEAGQKNVIDMRTAEPSSIALGAELLARLMSKHPDCDVIFCGNDDIALGALFECQRQGIRIPERLGIIGFNDLPYAKACVPPISTVTTPRYEIGYQAAKLLLRQLDTPDDGTTPPQTKIDLGFSLTIRGSA